MVTYAQVYFLGSIQVQQHMKVVCFHFLMERNVFNTLESMNIFILTFQGMHVTKLVGIMFILIFFMDLLAAVSYTGAFSGFIFTALVFGIITILLIISRQPQNR